MVTEGKFVLCRLGDALDRKLKQESRLLRALADQTVTGEPEAALDFIAKRPPCSPRYSRMARLDGAGQRKPFRGWLCNGG